MHRSSSFSIYLIVLTENPFIAFETKAFVIYWPYSGFNKENVFMIKFVVLPISTYNENALTIHLKFSLHEVANKSTILAL